MNKNTLLAIILSTIVVIASISIQSIYMGKSNPSDIQASSESVTGDSSVESLNNSTNTLGIDSKNTTNSSSVESSDLGNKDTQPSEDLAQSDKESQNVLGANSKTPDSSSDADAIYNANSKPTEIEIKTNKMAVILSSLGGDILSYKLDKSEHLDTDTGDGVEMCDGTSEFNRACAVSFGDVHSRIINEPFKISREKRGENGTETVLFTRMIDGVIFGKRYTFIDNEYMFSLELLFHNTHKKGESNEESEKKLSYTLRTAPQIGPHFDPKVNKYESRQFITFNGEKAKKINISSPKQFKPYPKSYDWNGVAGKYFISLIIPNSPSDMDQTYYSTLIDSNNHANAQAILTRSSFNLPAESDRVDTYHIYFGPRNEKNLKLYNTRETNFFNLSGERLNEALQSSGWLGWLETILKWMLEIINKFARNWGVSIILLTLIIKLLMFPMTKKQSLSTLKMQEIQPRIQALQAKYKDNPQKLQEAMAKVYKDAGYNPASGCLPLIIQFLILFAMYNLFNNYFEFRGKGFIPGWIGDLTIGDSVYTFEKNIPFFGNHLRILPIIYLISQLLFGKITGNAGTAAPSSTKMQMNLMMYGMPIMFFFLFYNAPSGLLLYWTVSNVFQMAQQIIINRALKTKKLELENKGTGNPKKPRK